MSATDKHPTELIEKEKKATNIIDRCIGNNYLLSKEERIEFVKLKAATSKFSRHVTGTWFKLCVATYTQALKNSNPHPSTIGGRLKVFDRVNDLLYADVKRAVVTHLMTTKQKQSATSFHRSAASTIRGGIAASYDFEGKDIKDIGKTAVANHVKIKQNSNINPVAAFIDALEKAANYAYSMDKESLTVPIAKTDRLAEVLRSRL